MASHQLIGLANATGQVFDSVIVVTDRRILDQQIRDIIKQFAQVGATVGPGGSLGSIRVVHSIFAAAKKNSRSLGDEQSRRRLGSDHSRYFAR